jgi:hypothetical protein
MAPRHADMHLVDPQLSGGAVRCQKSNSKDLFSSLLVGIRRKHFRATRMNADFVFNPRLSAPNHVLAR